METDTLSDAKEVYFKYPFRSILQADELLEYNISIPFVGDVQELAQEIILKHKSDPFIKHLDLLSDLGSELRNFINKHNQAYLNKRDNGLIEAARRGSIDVDQLIKGMDQRFREEIHQGGTDDRTNSEEELFSHRFHRLVHSPLLPEILQKEKQYAEIIGGTKHCMDTELAELASNQQEIMDATVEQLDVSTTTEEINNLLSEQYSYLNRVRNQYDCELEALKGHQKSEYHSWINGMLDRMQSTSFVTSPIEDRSAVGTMQSPPMEESFTIHLGSQLKHMHNIRILAADVIKLCGPLHVGEDSLSALNMALGLYSCSLYGIVVLTPVGRVMTNPSVNLNANLSTEFHFKQINDQQDEIQAHLDKTKYDSSPDSATTPSGNNKHCKLKPGDFFVTRHSNLSQTHVIFHLITDEAFSRSEEINSRHPVILGLRNILKTACRHDITMLTIPTLLRHEMSEDMTVPWCIRRAELVFKCAKGFMIESASWGGSQLSTLQLLLPHDISEELFGTLVGMIPHIFRVANPKILEESS